MPLRHKLNVGQSKAPHVGVPGRVTEGVERIMRQAPIQFIDQLKEVIGDPSIGEVTKDKDANVRCEAACALAALGAREYSAHIERLLKDDNGMVRGAAKAALDKLK